MWKPGTLLLLLLWLASGELQQETEPRRLPPPGKLNFGYVPAGVYETLAHYEPGPIGILFHMVHAFLYAVQPNAFPHGKHPQSSSRWLQHNKCRPSPGQRVWNVYGSHGGISYENLWVLFPLGCLVGRKQGHEQERNCRLLYWITNWLFKTFLWIRHINIYSSFVDIGLGIKTLNFIALLRSHCVKKVSTCGLVQLCVMRPVQRSQHALEGGVSACGALCVRIITINEPPADSSGARCFCLCEWTSLGSLLVWALEELERAWLYI